jgi:hypothetical protein
MHDVYQQSNERFIEEERPRVVQAASSSHNNHNIDLPYPYDPDDNEIDNGKETYYTNIKGKVDVKPFPSKISFLFIVSVVGFEFTLME